MSDEKTGFSTNKSPTNDQVTGPFTPPPINTLEDTGLEPLFLQDLALKILYFQGYLTGYKIAEALCLPFSGMVDQILDGLKKDKLVEVKSSQMGLGKALIYMRSPVRGLFMPVRRSIAVSMPDQHPYLWWHTTNPSAGKAGEELL